MTIIIWIMNFCLIVFPVALCDFPLWLDFLLVFCSLNIPYLSIVATLVIWIFSFINVIHTPFSYITVLYFVFFVVRIIIAFSSFNDFKKGVI